MILRVFWIAIWSSRQFFTFKRALYLSVNYVFITGVLIGDTIFVSNWRWDCHFTQSSEPCEDLVACTAKGVSSLLSYFKPLSIGLTLVTESWPPAPLTSTLLTELILPRLTSLFFSDSKVKARAIITYQLQPQSSCVSSWPLFGSFGSK